jgi:pyruvate/2-oxoglutarate/acetoin dehydrogenase E1 component
MECTDGVPWCKRCAPLAWVPTFTQCYAAWYMQGASGLKVVVPASDAKGLLKTAIRESNGYLSAEAICMYGKAVYLLWMTLPFHLAGQDRTQRR